MHRLLEDPAVAAYETQLGRPAVKRAAQRELARVRADPRALDDAPILGALLSRLADQSARDVTAVINATGILTHTNLGRAPLASEALSAVQRVAAGYCNLEYDLVAGERDSRYDRVADSVCGITGADDALIVNNCAAAVLLILDTLCKGREAIVSRGQLIEIGGGFRIPDVLARSGAILREVGTTNRTSVADFERAMSPKTALLLRVVPSNYRIEGFTTEPSGAELAYFAKHAGVLVVEDLGSGALVDLTEYGLPHERTVAEALADGIDVVACSGDKLLGGPQCGIILARSHIIARLRTNPLLRALRVDKLTLAALSATLTLHRSAESRRQLPLYRMLGANLHALRERARTYLTALPQTAVIESDAYVGGGALPQTRIASIALALTSPHPNAIAATLRRWTPPIVARIGDGQLIFDLRTIAPEEDDTVIVAVSRCTNEAQA